MKALLKYLTEMFQAASLRLMFILFSMIMLVSCEDYFVTEVDEIDMVGSEPQLVVYSYISPQDTILKVRVYRSKPYMMNPDNIEEVNEKAHVYMAVKGGSYKEFSYHNDLKCFVLPAEELEVLPDHYYQLKVVSFEGEEIKAECYIPVYQVENVVFEPPVSTVDSFGYGQTNFSWKMYLPSVQSQLYYRVDAFIDSYCVFEDSILGPYLNKGYFEQGEQIFASQNQSAFSFRNVIFIDNFYQGGFDGNGSIPVFRIDSIFVEILQTDYGFYRFHQSVNDYGNAEGSFPFAESVHIYSNIEGGLGVFGGYNKKTFKMPVDLN